MADITRLQSFSNGLVRGVDLTANSLMTESLKLTLDGGTSSSELTKAILDKLILINSAADVDGTFDTRYIQIANLAAAAGAALVGVDPASIGNSAATNLQAMLDDLDAEITNNASAISTNAGNISTNAGNIATNTSDIATNASNISTNASNISANAAAIALQPNSADVMLLDGSQAMAANLNMGTTNKIVNLATPTADFDAATKKYVDDSIGAISTDASAITYTPAVLANWDSAADPGEVDDALDQLAARVKLNDAKVSADGSVTSHSDVTDAGSGQIITASERSQISTNQSEIAANDTDIANLESALGNANPANMGSYTGSTITADQSAKQNIQELEAAVELKVAAADLASNANSLGASLVGIEDAAGKFAASNVEAALAEIQNNIDNAQAGLKVKDPVDVVATSNITLSGEQTIDGVLTSASRVLVAGQSSAVDNGIYVSAAGAWARAVDFDGTPSAEVSQGNIVYVLSGTDNADTQYVLNVTDASNPQEINVGTDTNAWSIYSRAQAIQAGDGLNKSGLSLSVVASAIAGAGMEDDGSNNLRLAAAAGGNGIAVSAGIIALDFSEFSTDDVIEGATNKYYASSLFDADFAGKTTDDLAEGASNKYYASSLFDADFAGKDSADLNHTQADANDWTVANGSSIAAHLDEAGDRLAKLEDGVDAIAESLDAGEAIASGLKAVRYMKSADAGFVAGRVVKAEIDASSSDDFYVIGIMNPSGALAAGDSELVVKAGKIAAAGHGFTVGAPIFLNAAGALTNTAPSANGEAVVRVGIAKDANTIDVQIQVMYVN